MRNTRSPKILIKILLLALFALLFLVAYQAGLAKALTFTFLQSSLSHIQIMVDGNPAQVMFLFFCFYIVVTAISFPGSSILCLLAGAIFGTTKGLILVSIASTIGATLAFWAARFLFRDFLEKKFGTRLSFINQNIERDGIWYLLTMRLIPVFPFSLVNFLMGVTSIRAPLFFMMSLLGMLPTTILLVFAGQRFTKINSLLEVFSPIVLTALILLGVSPYLAKFIDEEKILKLLTQ